MTDSIHPSTLARERASPEEWLPPWTRAEHEARYRFAAEYVRDRVVVDCACGNGLGSAVFLGHGPRRFVGVDAHPEAVARATSAHASPTASFVCADATALPLDTGSCDLFISLETIEHIGADRAFVAEASRVLRAEGMLICSTPNRNVTNPGLASEGRPWNPFHVREYSSREFEDLLGEHFVIEGAYGQNPNRKAKIAVLAWLGRHVHRLLPVRINQILKCRWFLLAQPRVHAVRPCDPSWDYEYLVLVCRRKPQP